MDEGRNHLPHPGSREVPRGLGLRVIGFLGFLLLTGLRGFRGLIGFIRLRGILGLIRLECLWGFVGFKV